MRGECCKCGGSFEWSEVVIEVRNEKYCETCDEESKEDAE